MLSLNSKERTKMSENDFFDQNGLDLTEDCESDASEISTPIYNLSIYLLDNPDKNYVNPIKNTPNKQVSGNITKINSLTIPTLDTKLKYTIYYSDSSYSNSPIKTLSPMYVRSKGNGNIQSQFSSSLAAP